MSPNNIPKKLVLSSKSCKQPRLLYFGGWGGGAGWEEENPKLFYSHAIYLFSTACLHIKCPGAKSDQLGGLLSRAPGRGARAPSLSLRRGSLRTSFFNNGERRSPEPRRRREARRSLSPPGGRLAGQFSAESGRPSRSAALQGMGQRRRRPRDRGHRSASPGTAAPPPPPRSPGESPRPSPAPPPPVLTAGRLGQRGDRGLAHGSAGRRSRRLRGAQPPPRLLPRGHPGAGRARAPRRLAGAGCSGCGPAAAACHPAELPGHRRGPGPSPPPRSAPAPPRARPAGGCAPLPHRAPRGSAGIAEVLNTFKKNPKLKKNLQQQQKPPQTTKPNRLLPPPPPLLSRSLGRTVRNWRGVPLCWHPSPCPPLPCSKALL